MTGFELRGGDDDETRLLVHVERGYSIAIPGRPHCVVAPSTSPQYDTVVQLRDAPIELGFRMDEVPGDITAEDLVPALVASYAASRAPEGANLAMEWVYGRARADGAGASMQATYSLRDDPSAMEFLVVTMNRSERLIHALHMTVRYRRGETTPFGWSNLRTALLYHQSWKPGQMASTELWPAESAFARRSVLFELTEDAIHEARRKARDVGSVPPEACTRLGKKLMEWTNRNFPPA